MTVKLTKAQREALAQMNRGADLANGDEYTPQWWIERGGKIGWMTARSLCLHKFVELYRHEGGQPGVLFYRISPAGRAALEAKEGGAE